jgi:hypothetical protein
VLISPPFAYNYAAIAAPFDCLVVRDGGQLKAATKHLLMVVVVYAFQTEGLGELGWRGKRS